MKDLEEMHICIVGLGLMGGSLALAIRDSVSSITAVDIDEEALKEALARNLVDRISTNLATGISDADIVVLATPVRAILESIKQLSNSRHKGVIITDVGSTKADIVEAMDRLPPRFEAIGAHPMCGRERSGLEAADNELFLAKSVILCRSKRSTERAQRVISNLFEAAGARIILLDAEVHDQAAAVTSHLPYLLAGVLSRLAAEKAAATKEIWDLTASGFADMTRLSGSDPAMMYDILVTNRTAVVSTLSAMKSQINLVLEYLNEDRESDLETWLTAVRRDYSLFRRS